MRKYRHLIAAVLALALTALTLFGGLALYRLLNTWSAGLTPEQVTTLRFVELGVFVVLAIVSAWFVYRGWKNKKR